MPSGRTPTGHPPHWALPLPDNPPQTKAVPQLSVRLLQAGLHVLHQLEVAGRQPRLVLRLQVVHERLHLPHEQLGSGAVRERQELVRLLCGEGPDRLPRFLRLGRRGTGEVGRAPRDASQPLRTTLGRALLSSTASNTSLTTDLGRMGIFCQDGQNGRPLQPRVQPLPTPARAPPVPRLLAACTRRPTTRRPASCTAWIRCRRRATSTGTCGCTAAR